MAGTDTLQRLERPVVFPVQTRILWPARAIAGVMVLIGATFIAVTLIVNLLSVGPAFDRLTDGFRPVMASDAIRTDRSDIALLADAGTEFQTTFTPALAQRLGITPTELTAMIQKQYPDVTAGLAALPTIVPTFDGLVTTLDEQRPLFRSADAIPTTDLPATTVPWGLLAIGAISIGLGVFTWYRPVVAVMAVLGLGVLLIAVPLLLTLPSKAADADDMNKNLEPVYTQQLITQAKGALATVSAMGTEMQAEMLPGLAAQLKMPQAQLQTFLSENFPATAAALGELPAALTRFDGLVAAFEQNLDEYNTLKPVEFLPIVQMLMIGGAAMVLVGGIGIAVTRLP